MAAKRRSKERREGGRNAKPTILIVCEGETEQAYFKKIKSKFRAVWIEVKRTDKPDPMGIVECAGRLTKELKSKGLEVETWIVLDAESEIEELRRRYKDALAKAKGKNYCLANSSPCFEYWPLLHFVPGINVTNPKEALSELSKPDRVLGYKKPNLPFDELWRLYESGEPSKAAKKRREDLSLLGEDPIYGRPVTFVDVLVDRICSMASQTK